MATKTAQANRVIGKNLSAAGAAWVQQMCNGFSDLAVVPVGYPDGHNSNTVVQCVKKAIAIQRSDLIPDTDPWNCGIVFTPNDLIMNYFGASNSTRAGNVIDSSGGPPDYENYGGVTVTQSDATFNQALAYGEPSVLVYNNTKLDSVITDSQTFRVVSFAMELTNNSAPINASGSCTVWTQPASTTNLGTWTDWFSATNIRSFQAHQMRLDPSGLPQATLLRGTKTWKATQGAYVNAKMSDLSNEFKGLSYVQPLYTLDDDISGTNRVLFPGGRPGLHGTNSSYPSHLNAFDPCGIYLFGLNPDATFTLEMRWYVETLPDPSSDLINLARSTLNYDFKALQTYMLVQKELPAGCPKGDNNSGDWISGVATIVKTLSGIAISSGNPYAAIAGAAGYIGADILDSFGKQPSSPAPRAPPPPRVQSTSNKRVVSDGWEEVKSPKVPPLGSAKFVRYSNMSTNQLRSMGFNEDQIKKLHKKGKKVVRKK